MNEEELKERDRLDELSKPIAPGECNALYFETQDCLCVWCKESCKRQFMIPSQVLRKWGLFGFHHWECGIEAMVIKKMNIEG